MKKMLPVVLRFWQQGEGHVRVLLPSGQWKKMKTLSQAREYSKTKGYDGIKVKPFA